MTSFYVSSATRITGLAFVSFAQTCQALTCGTEDCSPGINQCCYTSLHSRYTCCKPNDRDWMLKLSGMAFGAIGGLICIVIACSCCKSLKQRLYRNRNDVSPIQSHRHGNHPVTIDEHNPPSYEDVIASNPEYQEPPCYFKLYPVSANQTVEVSTENTSTPQQTNPAFEPDEPSAPVVEVGRTPPPPTPQQQPQQENSTTTENTVCTLNVGGS